QPDHLPATVGQAVEGLGQALEHLAAAAPAFWRHLIHQDVQGLEITHWLDRHHLAAAQAVGQQVARGGEQEGPRLQRARLARRLVDPRIDLLAQVGRIVAARAVADQVVHQRFLVDEDLADEPVVEAIGHGAHHSRCGHGRCPAGEMAPRFVSCVDGPYPGRKERRMIRAGAIRSAWLVVALLALPAAHALAADYERHVIGDRALATPGTPAPGLLLMGGGDRNTAALRWFLDKAGNGHVVVLRASLGGEIGQEFHDEVGGVASVETFVFGNRQAAHDRRLLASMRKADGIFIAGGDQSRYLRYWKGTPVEQALEAHVRAGKPLGGTSAGLAITSEFVYGAMDGGSQTSARALADPLGPENTIEIRFLDLDVMRGVRTDSHFRERNRLGRLLALVAKAETLSGGRPVLGLGVDEDAALAVDADGRTRVFATAPGAGATVVRGGFVQPQEEDRALRLDRVETVGVGVDSVLQLPTGEVERPIWRRAYAVRDGVLVAQDAPRLVIHGGAGVEPGDLTPEEEAAARAALAQALRAGQAALAEGRPALDAVTAAINVLEDAPMFNAGRGAVFTHDGTNELDTSIMDGATGRAGAAAGLRHVRNPITLARAIMERSRHVMMVGEGAERFAKEQGIALVEPAYFRT